MPPRVSLKGPCTVRHPCVIPGPARADAGLRVALLLRREDVRLVRRRLRARGDAPRFEAKRAEDGHVLAVDALELGPALRSELRHAAFA
eukprot:CAMPEP_0184118748 /NCGR_PEP_ID=MMETSP0974-20121125/21598_1 /TAXON_ID=483370 /ORGANISM="non described non described, Strain CCMP2097" /LENGTH=88 /DNA_ID=CAMNT_0026421897 /DNA_START=60 /DNA_END=326 /DNA_ORIENTATION=+